MFWRGANEAKVWGKNAECRALRQSEVRGRPDAVHGSKHQHHLPMVQSPKTVETPSLSSAKSVATTARPDHRSSPRRAKPMRFFHRSFTSVSGKG